MKKLIKILLALAFVIVGISGAQATTIALNDWAFYIDGNTYENSLGDSIPLSGALINGMGTLTWTTNAAGTHKIIAFFDHEIDESLNTFFNEFGTEVNAGSKPANQSWEIDEPGFVFGDIYSNVLAGSLDNSNGVPSGSPDDVSMAMGWDFILNPGDVAKITFALSNTAPAGGFYLNQTDPDSSGNIYFSGNLNVAPIPEPGTILLLGSGLLALAAIGRKKFKK